MVNEPSVFELSRFDCIYCFHFTESEVVVSWKSSLHELTIDWSNVFITSTNSSIFYEVTVRIKELASGDEVQWQETRETRLILGLDADLQPNTGFTVLATVRGISYCGLFTTVQQEKYLIW